MWRLLLNLVGFILLVVLAYGILLVVRRRALARNGGTFELSYRLRAIRPGRGWVLGMGRYSGESLEWFRIFSLSPVPGRVWTRADLEYVTSREPEGVEELSLYADHLVVTCEATEATEIQFAMSPAALTGFQAWLQAMPPGTRSVRFGEPPGVL
jgi:hypothetical protein